MTGLVEAHEYVGSKLKWGRSAIRDKTVSVTARLISAYIMHALDTLETDPRRAWAYREEMADQLGLSVKTVTRGLAELRLRGWIKSTVGGRGQPNKIEPTQPVTEADKAGTQSTKDGHQCPAKPPKSWSPPTEKVVRHDPSLKEENNSPLPPKRRRSTGAGHDQCPAPPQPTFRETEIRARLTLQFGERFVRSYLDPAAWEPSTRRVVCRGTIGHDRLKEQAGRMLSEMRVRIVLDPGLHARLPRPLIPMQEAA